MENNNQDQSRVLSLAAVSFTKENPLRVLDESSNLSRATNKYPAF
jgi:hypothetical protein